MFYLIYYQVLTIFLILILIQVITTFINFSAYDIDALVSLGLKIHQLALIRHFNGSVLLQGGDVMQESITANVTEDTVTLEFLRLDGVFISQLVDFANVRYLTIIITILRTLINIIPIINHKST